MPTDFFAVLNVEKRKGKHVKSVIIASNVRNERTGNRTGTNRDVKKIINRCLERQGTENCGRP